MCFTSNTFTELVPVRGTQMIAMLITGRHRRRRRRRRRDGGGKDDISFA